MKCLSLLVLLGTSLLSFSQNSSFEILLEPASIDGLGGLQSFAHGQNNNRWLLIGGRLDGLHRRQPFASFDLAGHNNLLYVVEPATGNVWSSNLEDLDTSLAEQLASTNMEFTQRDEILYLIGGYGYSAINGDHVTHPFLTAIDIPGVINAIIDGTDLSLHFRRINDEFFAVTGGHLDMMNGDFYLTGGQRFDGRYNPMGPDHGPGFSQEYQNAVHHISIEDDGINLSYNLIESFVDEDNLHRRDFNVSSQIMPDGQEGITAFSGVFRPDADLPFLNCVNIQADGYAVNNDFAQYYNHYHCANIPLYSSSQNEMHTLFFGGIAQYYFDGGVLIQDDNVPFVRTIARVTRDENGEMVEYKLPIEMPDLLGAGSEFIINPSLPTYSNGVIQMDELEADTVELGYIFGGIRSTDINIFWINDGSQSTANNELLKVSLVKTDVTGLDELNPHSNGNLKMMLYPNPNLGTLNIDLMLQTIEDLEILIADERGRQLGRFQYPAEQLSIGKNQVVIDLEGMNIQGSCLVTVTSPSQRLTQKLLIE